ncbi:MAG: hypothetical protein RL172_268 [Bacteroidota bacterium]
MHWLIKVYLLPLAIYLPIFYPNQHVMTRTVYCHLNNLFKKVSIALVIFIAGTSNLLAQGDGPRSMLLAPKGLWGVDAKWINLKQNLSPAGNILIPGADLTINLFPITLFHTFGIGGKFAQVYAMVNPGKVKGVINGLPIPIQDREASGTSDGFIGFKLGLIGAPALNVVQFAGHQKAFSMNFQFRTWYSGSYNSNKAINLGTNRLTFEFGLPMALPFGNNKKYPWWFETMPSVEFYTTNNDPFFIPGSRVNSTRQKALFVIENHLSKNITPKFWMGVGLRYQNGGKLVRDDVPQLDSRLNILGAGIDAGYQVLPFLDLKASYGKVLAGYNGATSRMFRLGATFVYADLKKAKAEMAPANK